VDSSVGTGQARIHLRAGAGATNRASRIDFFNNVLSSTVPQWTIISGYDQNGTNDMRYVNYAGAITMAWAQNGNIGIGTTNPGSLLTVSGGVGIGSGYQTITAPTNGLIVQGNVGIGTTNPGVNALQVTGNVVTQGFTSNATNTVFNFDTLTVPFVNATQIGVGTTSSTYPFDVLGIVRAGSTVASSIYLTNSEVKWRGDGTAHFSIFNQNSTFQIRNTSANFEPGTAGSNLVTVTSTGNVGIGMTDPSNALDVSSSQASARMARFCNFKNDGGSQDVCFIHTDQSFNNAVWSGSALTVTTYPSNGTNNAGYIAKFGTSDSAGGSMDPKVVISAAYNKLGFVGIGTVSPQTVLDVRNSALIGDYAASGLYNANAALHIRRSGVNPHLIFENIGVCTGGIAAVSGGMVYGTDQGGFHAFRTGCTTAGDYPSTGTERMRINTTGLGIGTASPSSILDIRGGSISFGSYDTTSAIRYVGIYNVNDGNGCLAGMELENTTLGGNYSQKLHFRTHYFGSNNGRRLTIDENGYVNNIKSYKQNVFYAPPNWGYSTSSTGWQQLWSFSYTLSQASYVTVSVQGHWSASSAGVSAYIQPLIDGNATTGVTSYFDSWTAGPIAGINGTFHDYWYTGWQGFACTVNVKLSAGSHTFGLGMNTGNAGSTIYANGAGISLQAIPINWL
jgi:hypothetical protein